MTIARMRNIAASLMSISGIIHIAQLWLRDINGEVLIGAMFGAFYLIIGIGLYGQSRFTLFIAIVVPAIGATLAMSNQVLTQTSPLGLSLLAIDGVVILLSSIVLYKVRNNPSV